MKERRQRVESFLRHRRARELGRDFVEAGRSLGLGRQAGEQQTRLGGLRGRFGHGSENGPGLTDRASGQGVPEGHQHLVDALVDCVVKFELPKFGDSGGALSAPQESLRACQASFEILTPRTLWMRSRRCYQRRDQAGRRLRLLRRWINALDRLKADERFVPRSLGEERLAQVEKHLGVPLAADAYRLREQGDPPRPLLDLLKGGGRAQSRAAGDIVGRRGIDRAQVGRRRTGVIPGARPGPGEDQERAVPKASSVDVRMTGRGGRLVEPTQGQRRLCHQDLREA